MKLRYQCPTLTSGSLGHLEPRQTLIPDLPPEDAGNDDSGQNDVVIWILSADPSEELRSGTSTKYGMTKYERLMSRVRGETENSNLSSRNRPTVLRFRKFLEERRYSDNYIASFGASEKWVAPNQEDILVRSYEPPAK